MNTVAGTWRASPAHFRAVAVGVVGVTLAVLFRRPDLLVLASPFAVVAVWSALARPATDGEVASAIVPDALREGEATTWRGEMSDAIGVDHLVAYAPQREWLETKPPSGIVVVPNAGSGAATRVEIPIRATHWGTHRVGPINVVGVSAWGAFRWRGVDAGLRLRTLPLPEVFDALAPMHRATGLVGLARSARPGEGSEFAGIRAFHAGDRLRRINWPRSLRGGELHVTATYADQDHHVALFVDALSDFGVSEGIDGAASSLDTGVRAAGAIAAHFLRRGDRVSLTVLGGWRPTSIPPATGQRHLRRILDTLAAVEPGRDGRGSSLAGRPIALSGDAMAVMLSPLISPFALERVVSIASHGLTVAVVDTLPDDVHVDDDDVTTMAWRIRLLERQAEIRTVRQAGVPVVAWRGAGSLDPFLHEIARRSSAPRMARR
jgi:uncharacterized protein (DUF58 family)